MEATTIDEIHFGLFKMFVRDDGDGPYGACGYCMMALSPEDLRKDIRANETGFWYCSHECAGEHVKEQRPEGGY